MELNKELKLNVKNQKQNLGGGGGIGSGGLGWVGGQGWM